MRFTPRNDGTPDRVLVAWTVRASDGGVTEIVAVRSWTWMSRWLRRQKPGLAAAQPLQLPKGQIGKLEISRVICGGNLIGGIIPAADRTWLLESGVAAIYTTADGLVHNSVRTIRQTRDGALWIGTTDGLSRFSDGRFTNFTAADGLASTHVRASEVSSTTGQSDARITVPGPVIEMSKSALSVG